MTAVALERISKRFGAATALTDVSLSAEAGEVHAVVGGNGAGKSTLMKILAGVVRPDQGRLVVGGRSVAFASAADAHRCGVATVFQELNLFPHRSVVENLFAGRERRRRGLLDHRAMRAEAARVLAEVGLAIPPEARVGSLSLAERQLVEIARTLLHDARIVILDEPNSALTEIESRRLFEIVGRLRDRGSAVLYVSQRLDDVYALADRITVMREGRCQGVYRTDDLAPSALAGLLTGGRAAERPSASARTDELALVVQGLTHGRLGPIDLEVHAGEIVGVAGLEGSGVDELYRVLFGLSPATAGRLVLQGRPLRVRSPADAIRAGVALVPGSRREHGLFPGWTAERNAALLSLDRLRNRLGLLDRGRTREEARGLFRRLGVVARGPEQPMEQLSGGNQQKVLFGRWLATQPRLLLLLDPTRGVDPAARRELHALCRAAARRGVPVLFSSSDIDETRDLCDRIAVLRRGRVTSCVEARTVGREQLLLEMSGVSDA